MTNNYKDDVERRIDVILNSIIPGAIADSYKSLRSWEFGCEQINRNFEKAYHLADTLGEEKRIYYAGMLDSVIRETKKKMKEIKTGLKNAKNVPMERNKKDELFDELHHLRFYVIPEIMKSARSGHGSPDEDFKEMTHIIGIMYEKADMIDPYNETNIRRTIDGLSERFLGKLKVDRSDDKNL
jgi:hypothetical protein